jgi:polar amino acid transport system substrate-binding protein
VIGAEFETGEQYGLAVRSGNTALLDAVNSTLARIAADGTYDEVYAGFVVPVTAGGPEGS